MCDALRRHTRAPWFRRGGRCGGWVVAAADVAQSVGSLPMPGCTDAWQEGTGRQGVQLQGILLDLYKSFVLHT